MDGIGLAVHACGSGNGQSLSNSVDGFEKRSDLKDNLLKPIHTDVFKFFVLP